MQKFLVYNYFIVKFKTKILIYCQFFEEKQNYDLQSIIKVLNASILLNKNKTEKLVYIVKKYLEYILN